MYECTKARTEQLYQSLETLRGMDGANFDESKALVDAIISIEHVIAENLTFMNKKHWSQYE